MNLETALGYYPPAYLKIVFALVYSFCLFGPIHCAVHGYCTEDHECMDVEYCEKADGVRGLCVRFANPLDETGNWTYTWDLIQGKGLGFPNEFNKKQIVISQLQEGTMRFVVRVMNETMDGYSSRTLKILPKSVTLNPKAVIRPPGPIFAVENNEIVLDGSGSIDYDGKITNYTWKLAKGVAANLPPLNVPVIKIPKLSPGNYSFELNIVDSKGKKDQTDVNIIVRSANDILPKASITGCDEPALNGIITLRLPYKRLLLCGKDLTDNDGIVSYNWARIDNNHNTPIDYSGSSSSTLQLTNLHPTEKAGDGYEFRLKITNAKQQTDVATIKIVVKDKILTPPETSAGADQTIILPQNSAMLDGSAKGEGKIASTHWKQIKGRKVKIINADKPKASVVDLEEGTYQFRFDATNEAGFTSHAEVTLNVIRTKNEPPIALVENATVILPANMAILNGSGSTDDAGIVSYEWKPMDYVPASVTMLGNSSKEANLMLTNLIEGRFLFNLTVWDVSHKSHSTVAELVVKTGSEEENSVQLFLKRNVRKFSHRWSRKLANRLSAALAAQIAEADTVHVKFTKFVEDPASGLIAANFYAVYTPQKEYGYVEATNTTSSAKMAPVPFSSDDHKIVYAPRVVEILRREIVIIHEFEIVEINSLHCFLDCSGHGVCNNYTKQCDCDIYWMANIFHRFISRRQEDCSWSLLYVWLLVFLLLSPPITKLLHLCWMAKRKRFSHTGSYHKPSKRTFEFTPLFRRGAVPSRLSPSVPRKGNKGNHTRRHIDTIRERDGFMDVSMTSGMEESDDTVFDYHKHEDDNDSH
ncbi:dyslexia-associated protein like protein [Ditylenchus destructor]|nr:dyslexia-associated protein like protein [Ditylenchus destructor]